MSKQKTFKEILEAEKKKVQPITKWHVFVSGKDIPHKDKSKYSRREKHKADPQGNQPFLYLNILLAKLLHISKHSSSFPAFSIYNF